MIDHVAHGATKVDQPSSDQKPDWTNPPDQHHPSQSKSATALKTKPKRETKPDRKVDRMPPWRVLLHNDARNDMGYVVDTLIELTALSPQLALIRMLEAHTTGIALIATTHREYAELLHDQFKSKGLMVTIEPEN